MCIVMVKVGGSCVATRYASAPAARPAGRAHNPIANSKAATVRAMQAPSSTRSDRCSIVANGNRPSGGGQPNSGIPADSPGRCNSRPSVVVRTRNNVPKAMRTTPSRDVMDSFASRSR